MQKKKKRKEKKKEVGNVNTDGAAAGHMSHSGMMSGGEGQAASWHHSQTVTPHRSPLVAVRAMAGIQLAEALEEKVGIQSAEGPKTAWAVAGIQSAAMRAEKERAEGAPS